MRKIIAFVLVLALTLSLAGCGNNLKEIKSITYQPEGPSLCILETFFSDMHNIYQFGETISQYVIVEYMDGTTENVKEALENGHIKITDLDTYGIQYYTYPREYDIGGFIKNLIKK